MNGRPFAVFDIDGTIFRWQLYHELFDALVDKKLIVAANAAKVFAARESWRNREIEYDHYEDVLINVMEAAIIGLEEQTFHEVADDILARKGHHIYRYTLDLLTRLKSEGYVIIAISGSHQQLIDRFAQLHKIDIAVGRQFHTKDGKLTSASNMVFGNKHTLLQDIVNQHDLSWDGSYAVGDSASDIAMLELVEHPIAFNPNHELLETAKDRGWPIVIERKSLSYRLEKGEDGRYVLA